MLDWIKGNYLLTSAGDQILFPIDSTFTVMTDISAFTALFGDIITNALTAGTDPKQAIKDSDPNNTLGFNDIV